MTLNFLTFDTYSTPSPYHPVFWPNLITAIVKKQNYINLKLSYNYDHIIHSEDSSAVLNSLPSLHSHHRLPYKTIV